MSKNLIATHHSTSLQDTSRIAQDVLSLCDGRATSLALIGELGAGKTQFTKFLGEHLGVRGNIQSPTFVLMKKYKPTHTFDALYHFDWYRLDSEEEVFALGWESIVKKERILVVVEWADKLPNLMSQMTYQIHFTATGDHTHTISLYGTEKT